MVMDDTKEQEEKARARAGGGGLLLATANRRKPRLAFSQDLVGARMRQLRFDVGKA
jgi:hypothetical protein